jgi:Tol biopolymer transport system component
VFVSGDSYAGTAFSTRTSVLDTRTWQLQSSLETYAITKDGHAYRAADVNFWGVTFADDTRFYATLATGGKTYLVRGDATAGTLRTLRENVECPSLSPDGTRVAFKQAVDGDPAQGWRLTVLDLTTLRRTPLAETRSVDDQAAWLGDHTVMYALHPGAGRSDVWSVPADGTGKPAILVPDAESPAAL